MKFIISVQTRTLALKHRDSLFELTHIVISDRELSENIVVKAAVGQSEYSFDYFFMLVVVVPFVYFIHERFFIHNFPFLKSPIF